MAMPQPFEIAGVPLEQIEAKDGITYTYPIPRMPRGHLELAAELSEVHAVNGVHALGVDPSRYPAQGSFFMDSKPQAVDGVIWAGEKFVPGFGKMVERALNDPAVCEGYERMAEVLEPGGNIIHGVDHGSLPDIGVKHGLAYVVLTRLGCKFVAGSIFNEGVTTLGYDLGGDEPIPLPNALSLASHKTWYVISPRFRGEIPDDDTARQNRVAQQDIADTQDGGGAFITVALSGGSDKIGWEDGRHWIEAPKSGTLRLAAHPLTRVQLHVGKVYGVDTPENVLWGEPRQLRDDETLAEQGYNLMDDMTAGLNEGSSGVEYAFLDPRVYSAATLQNFRRTRLIREL